MDRRMGDETGVADPELGDEDRLLPPGCRFLGVDGCSGAGGWRSLSERVDVLLIPVVVVDVSPLLLEMSMAVASGGDDDPDASNRGKRVSTRAPA